MRFQFILTHTESGQSLEITEPDAWKEAVLKLERHEEFHSLIEYFEGSFIFYGNNGDVNGGIDFIRAIVRDYGIDATLSILISLTFDEFTFDDVFIGQLKITDAEEMPNNKMRVPIIRDDNWAKFIARINTPVDIQSPLNIDELQTEITQQVILKMHPQKIQKKYTGELRENVFIPSLDLTVGEFIQTDFDHETLDEISEKFHLPNSPNSEIPVNIFYMNEEGDYSINIRIEAMLFDNITADQYPSSGYIKYWIQFGTSAPIALTETNFGVFPNQSTVYEFIGNIHLLPGGTITLYAEVLLDISLVNDPSTAQMAYSIFTANSDTTPSGAGNEEGILRATHMYVTGQTTIPQTNNEIFLLHDVGSAITDRLIGELDTFYSEHLGGLFTTKRQYDQNGCAWNYGLVKGLQLRQYLLSEKPFFMSFNQWWKGINPILNLSLMYDEIEGNPVIRVEQKDFQYDSGTSINFSHIRDITRKYDNELIFNKIEIGYARWQSEDVSGIDDPQSKKTYATRFKKIGKPLTLYSEFIAASLAIETTRRQTRLKSADYKFDNETFIIALNTDLQEESPDVSPDLLQFIPELDENFVSITNLLNSETRYNNKITPGRNFLRWQPFVQGCLQDYLGSNFKFVSGEGNYDMTSEMITEVPTCSNEDYDGNVLDEKGNIIVTDDFLHLADLYEAQLPMEWDEYKTIRENRRKPIGISLTDTDHVPMFIKMLDYKPVKGTASVLMWAKEYLDLSVIEDTFAVQECYISDECADALTDELGDILTDELGVCLVD